MSRRVSSGRKLCNCSFVLLSFIFAVSTSAESSNRGIAPSGQDWEESTRSLWTAKGLLSKGGQRKYVYSIDEEGTVWIKTQGKAIFDRNPSGSVRNRVPEELSYLCSVVFGTSLASTITEYKKKLRVGEYPQIIQGKCVDRQAFQKQQLARLQRQRELEKSREDARKREAARQQYLLEIEMLERKTKCSSYGFTAGTDGHANCVMELAIAAEASERQRLADAARAAAIASQAAAANAASAAAADEARRQRQAQALIGLGAAISSGGASPSSSSSSPIAPLSSGRYKTCRYRVSGEIVSSTVGRAELCPATRSIGGQTGYLVR